MVVLYLEGLGGRMLGFQHIIAVRCGYVQVQDCYSNIQSSHSN